MITDFLTKTTREEIIAGFDCSPLIASGDSISLATVVVTDINGADVSGTMLSGSAVVSGTNVTQKIIGGTNNQNYLATLQITTTNGEKLDDTLNIRVRNDTVEIFGGLRGTLGEYKKLMRMATDDYDDNLRIMIPALKEFICEYCRTYFKNNLVSYTADTIAFVNGSPCTITDSGSYFLEEYFASGIDIVVEGSINNDGIYYVTTAATGTLTLDSEEILINESAGEATVTLTRVVFPKGLKILMAQMLAHLIKSLSFQDSDKEVASETIGNYSVRYRTMTTDDFPAEMIRILNSHRRVGLN